MTIYGHRIVTTFDDEANSHLKKLDTLEVSSKRSFTSMSHLYCIEIIIQTLIQMVAMILNPCPYKEMLK